MYTKDIFGFLKPLVDVHTMGIYAIVNLLRDCGYSTHMATDDVNKALESIKGLNNYGLVKKWILDNGITRLGFSYRLDPNEGCDYFMSLFYLLKNDNMFSENGGPLSEMSFAGLPDTCEMIRAKTNGLVLVFPGNESPIESLQKYNIPESLFPKSIVNDSEYDAMIRSFAHHVIESERYKLEPPQDHYGYSNCGTSKDSYLERLIYSKKKKSLPIIRTHSGPYNPNRYEALKEYNSWCDDLAKSKLLDVLSIGSSQLTQSHFGEDWDGLANGGGVPINSEIEYKVIAEKASPMLVRTYSGTKNVPELARIHERALNISWHALSFWWFNQLDGRGNNSLLDNLREHFDAVKYIATTNKPVEPNVPHHFSFRGGDDITYIVSGYMAAKVCKQLGIKHLILQNMLNTPKYTWGIQDLAKGRALLKLVRTLEDETFSVSLQTRAGLDYFSPDLDEAKVQLAAVTCMMDDIEPENDNSPEIIHVVNYSEAVRLATPPIIKESIQITLSALHEYRLARKLGKVPDMRHDKEVNSRFEELYNEAHEAIKLLEDNISNLYTPEGFAYIFEAGFFPVPYLMDQDNKFPYAKKHFTALKNGGIRVIDEKGNVLNTVKRYQEILDKTDSFKIKNNVIQ